MSPTGKLKASFFYCVYLPRSACVILTWFSFQLSIGKFKVVIVTRVFLALYVRPGKEHRYSDGRRCRNERRDHVQTLSGLQLS